MNSDRSTLLKKLSSHYRKGIGLPSSVFVCGPPQSGKMYIVNQVLEDKEDWLSSVTVSCQSGCVHPRLIFEPILCELLGLSRCTTENFSSPIRCDNFADFVHILKEKSDELFADRSKGIAIVLKRAEKLRELDSYILHGFLRLRELLSQNISVVPTGLPEPIFLKVDAYTEKEMISIIARQLYERDRQMTQMRNDEPGEKAKVELSEDFFVCYATTVVRYAYTTCNSLPKLLWLADLHLPLYKSPVVEGSIEPDNVRALYRQIEKPLLESLNHIHLRENCSKQYLAETRNSSLHNNVVKNSRLYVELPYHSKFLLIAAYLASYNPVKSDRRFFMKNHGKQRKTLAMIKAKENKVSSQLLGPKTFPLDRMLAIFYSIIDEDVSSTANILSQISSLVTLQFLVQISSSDVLNYPKYRCVVGLELISQISKTVEFEVHRYLYDFN